MRKLLAEQIDRSRVPGGAVDLARLVEQVSATYETFEKDRRRSERASRLMAAELEHRSELWRFQANLLEIAAKISPPEIVAAEVCLMFETFVQGATCSIMKLEAGRLSVFAAPTADRNWWAAMSDLPAEEWHCSCGTAAFTGEPQFVENARTDPRWEKYLALAEQYDIRASWSYPILGRNRTVLGTVSLISSKRRQPSELHQDMLKVGAYLIASAWDNALAQADRVRVLAEKQAAVALANETAGFLANMSHEIRTPMNGILGALDLMRVAGTEVERNELLISATESGEVLLNLIDEILDYSKLEHAGLELSPADTNLTELVHSIVGSLQPIAKKNNNELQVRIGADVPDVVRVDGLRLRQVLVNLVGNALKFTTDGRIEVTVETIETSAHAATIRFCVTDTGVGIPPDKLATVFERFRSLDQSFTRKCEGTGLGLSISNKIAELMGGKIEVESEVGVGSRFWLDVTLPLVLEQRPAHQDAQKVDTVRLPCLRVLLAEDNETNAMIAIRFLDHEGHIVTRVRNGAEAVAEANNAPYDIILMDISMPQMDGVTATRLIRSGDGPNADAPIIALTAHVVPRLRKQILDAGITDYVSKPIRRNALVAILKDWSVAKREPKNRCEPHSEEAVIDRARFAKLVEDFGADDIPMLIDVLIGEFMKNVEAIIQLKQSEDMAMLERLAHKVAGGALTVGAVPLERVAREIESIAHRRESFPHELTAQLVKSSLSTSSALSQIVLTRQHKTLAVTGQ